LYVFDKPKTEAEREHNKETRILAENVRAKRQLELQAGNYGFLVKKRQNTDFLKYFPRQQALFYSLFKTKKSRPVKGGFREGNAMKYQSNIRLSISVYLRIVEFSALVFCNQLLTYARYCIAIASGAVGTIQCTRAASRNRNIIVAWRN
jgi:hypothetical protein